MIRTLKIRCPECHDTCELFLSTTASIIVLNCPNCWTPLLSNDEGVFILSEDQLTQIAMSEMPTLPTPLKRPVPSASPRHLSSAESSFDYEPRYHAHRPMYLTSRRSTISKDDVIDLRIDLARCEDSIEFIEML